MNKNYVLINMSFRESLEGEGTDLRVSVFSVDSPPSGNRV